MVHKNKQFFCITHLSYQIWKTLIVTAHNNEPLRIIFHFILPFKFIVQKIKLFFCITDFICWYFENMSVLKSPIYVSNLMILFAVIPRMYALWCMGSLRIFFSVLQFSLTLSTKVTCKCDFFPPNFTYLEIS